MALSAAFVSQLTCLALLGIDPRRYLDLVVPICRDQVIRLGKLRILELHVAVSALRALIAVDAAENTKGSPSQPQTLDEVLSSLGRERAA